MTWQQCPHCRWWRRPNDTRNACGCSRSALRPASSKPPAAKKVLATASRLPTGEDLAHRWQMANPAASNTQHIKIEKICAVCHSRNFGNKTSCRSCGSSLDGAYTLLPGQWPPLGVPPQVLALHEAKTETSAPVEAPPPPRSTAQDVSSAGLTIPQLKTELQKLERTLSDALVTEGSQATAEQKLPVSEPSWPKTRPSHLLWMSHPCLWRFHPPFWVFCARWALRHPRLRVFSHVWVCQHHLYPCP